VAIITAAQAKAYIPTLSASSSTDDTLLNTLISRFDTVAAGHLGFVRQSSGAISIESGTYVEYLDGPGGRELHLSAKPVTAVASIYDDADAEYTSDELIAASDYTLYGIEGLVMLDTTGADTYFSTAHRAIKATYTAGYSGGTMPGPITHAACLQVAHWYNHRASIGKTNVSSQGQSANLQSLDLLPEVKAALQPYRLATNWVG